MATPTVREVLLNQTTSSVSVSLGSGTATTDTLVAVCQSAFRAVGDLDTPPSGAGWSQIATAASSGTGVVRLRAWRRQVTVAGAQTVTWTPPGGTNTSGLIVFVLPGVDSTTPIDAFDDASGSSGTHTVGPVTTTVPDALLLGFWGAYGGGVTYSGASTPLSTAAGAGGAYKLPSSSNNAIMAASGALTAAGSTGTKSATHSGTPSSWASLLIAVRGPQNAPPVVNAGADVVSHPVFTEFTRTGTESGAGVTARAWKITAGPDGVGTTLSTSASLSWVPTVQGAYTLSFEATNQHGTSADTMTITVVPVPVGGTRLPASPGEALWIGGAGGKNHFDVGIGVTDAGGGTWSEDDHDDFSQAVIEGGYENDPKFLLLPDGNVQFRIGVNDGRTSSGTNYPRSELREYNEDGVTKSAWSGSSGTHYMRGRSRVTRVAPVKPWVCIFQVHDSSSDLLRVQCESGGTGPEGLRLRARFTPPGGSDTIAELLPSFAVGQWYDWELRIASGTLTIDIDGATVFTRTGMGTTGCYFKTGAYAQSNTSTENGDASQWFAVEMEAGSLEVWHTGYTAPTEPVFTGELVGGGASSSGFLPFFNA